MKKHESKPSEEVDQRWAEFWSEHQNVESPWARDVLHMLSEFLPLVFKFEAVRHGLEELYTRSGVQCPPDWDWSNDWTAAAEALPAVTLRGLPIVRLGLALEAYAYYGLKLELEESNGTHTIDLFLEDLRDAKVHPGRLSLFPLEWSGKEMEQTINAALAREKLDFPEIGGMTPEELAALVKLPRKNIVNLLAPNQGILKTDARGLISIESVQRWLDRRSDFRPSVWQQQSEAAVSAPDSETLLGEDLVFVPVASDGKWFSPNNCNTEGTRHYYYVASGDREEKKFEDYWSALDFLHRAKVPQWRYRDAAKRWRSTIGRADAWARKPRAEIEAILHAIPSPQP
jgi:hypothetical protein